MTTSPTCLISVYYSSPSPSLEVPIPRDNLLEYSYVYDTTPFDIQYVSLHTTRLIYNRTGDNKYIKKDNQVDYEYIIDVYGVDPNTDRIYKWQVYKLQHALEYVVVVVALIG